MKKSTEQLIQKLLLLSDNATQIKEIAFAANTPMVSDFSETLTADLEACEYLVLRRPQAAIFTQADQNLRSVLSGDLVYTDKVFEVYTCNSTI